MADPESIKKALQKEMSVYQTLQQELSKFVKTRTELSARANETDIVLEELKLLDDDANVFKSVGPVLVRQDLVEARSNVTNRLEFIKKDLERLDGQIKSLEGRMMEREKEMMKLQGKLRAAGGSGASA
ncbi:hypothetical protein HYH03_003581 [Edaphochlamys debaryana]|uniref:Prefoldin subunit 6 n=1 Tax=Edaphochlamys debaryana TaxID=47281 RepID=A0A835YCJ8_9CHLO|nr:hypothetical protein HYH03_003581 [Edaphochlamys debaryana]|eukprot:KAG2498321.1 hypothetical protein HYH03_003581 [Edaphochlamys debaryana]